MPMPVPGREASPACLPRPQCPTAFLEGGITFDSQEHLRSGARGFPPGYTDSAHVLFTPVSGVGGGCLRVSLPRVSEQEETSGSLCPPGGCPPLPRVCCLPGRAESQEPQVPLPHSPSALGSHRVLRPLYLMMVIRGCDIPARVNWQVSSVQPTTRHHR